MVLLGTAIGLTNKRTVNSMSAFNYRDMTGQQLIDTVCLLTAQVKFYENIGTHRLSVQDAEILKKPAAREKERKISSDTSQSTDVIPLGFYILEQWEIQP